MEAASRRLHRSRAAVRMCVNPWTISFLNVLEAIATRLEEPLMASNPIAVDSKLTVMASNLEAVASKLISFLNVDSSV